MKGQNVILISNGSLKHSPSLPTLCALMHIQGLRKLNRGYFLDFSYEEDIQVQGHVFTFGVASNDLL